MKPVDLSRALKMLDELAALRQHLQRFEGFIAQDLTIQVDRVNLPMPRAHVIALAKAEIQRLEQELTRLGVEL